MAAPRKRPDRLASPERAQGRSQTWLLSLLSGFVLATMLGCDPDAAPSAPPEDHAGRPSDGSAGASSDADRPEATGGQPSEGSPGDAPPSDDPPDDDPPSDDPPDDDPPSDDPPGDDPPGDDPPSDDPPSDDPPSDDPPSDDPPSDDPPNDDPPNDDPPSDDPPDDDPPGDAPPSDDPPGDNPPDDEPPPVGDCSDGEAQATPCGLNGRGQLLLGCDGGVWTPLSECQDPDLCLDTATQVGDTPCGLNSRGTLEQICDDGQWRNLGGCTDADVCLDGSAEPGGTTCGLNERGAVQLICVTGQWQDGPECLDPDACADGATQMGSLACGLNGRGLIEQLCVAGQWQDAAGCLDPDLCVDNATQPGSTACGNNGRGSLQQFCAAGQWQDSPTCDDPDLCGDGETQPGSRSCGHNDHGVLEQECTLGQWQDTSSCLDPDACPNGDTQSGTTACGNNGRGLLEQICADGQWQDGTNCVDPDECSDNALRTGTTPCGLNGRGLLEQQCTLGQWQDSSVCVDPDECSDGATRAGPTPCGSGGEGTLQQLCATGAWQDSSTCLGGAAVPNILLIIADDVGVESSSLYPSALGTQGAAPMPNLEALASQGLTFDSAWANPVCSPTRGTIVSGLYGNRTGVLTPGDRLDPDVVTIYDYLSSAEQAYDIGVFGKWHLAGVNGNDNQSVEVQHVSDSGVPFFEGFVGGGVDDYFSWPLISSAGLETSMTEYSTSVITDRAIDYIATRETTAPDSPWFAHVAYNAAHSPYQVPPSELHGVDLGDLEPGDAATTLPVYQAMIEAMDTEIGRLLGVVDLSETLVIYLGDNGTPSQVKDSSSPVRGSKISTYEGGVWVPLVMAGAGVTRIGEREEAIVSSVDLYATIISQAGYSISQLNDSFSVTPLLSDASASTGREYAFTEHCSSNFSLGRHIAIRNQQYKLLRTRTTWGLYDLVSDPSESNNLYDNPSFASVQDELEEQLAAIQADAVAGCF